MGSMAQSGRIATMSWTQKVVTLQGVTRGRIVVVLAPTLAYRVLLVSPEQGATR